jgi:acetolactate synthase-1/2/3 large subunit
MATLTQPPPTPRSPAAEAPRAPTAAPRTVKLADYVADFLHRQGVDRVFGLTGGAVVHLLEAVAQHPGMQPVFLHHEQAAAFAAEGYARIHRTPGACMVTTGPGGTNALTGVTAAWLDSVPCFYLSGQVRLAHTGRGHAVRQVGTQHLDIVALAKPITKYAVMIEDPSTIRYHLEKAAWLCRHGRPGPVWIDIPLDMQWAQIDPESQPGFTPLPAETTHALPVATRTDLERCAQLLRHAKRPLVLAGYGIRLSGADAEFRHFVESLGVPFIASWNASDMLPGDHPLNVGRPGIFGQRGANLAMQNCDLLVAVGSHLCVSLTGTMFQAFARDAKIVMVDLDPVELEHRTVRVDLPIRSDARAFLDGMAQLPEFPLPLAIDPAWLTACERYRTHHNRVPEQWYSQPEKVNPYVFMEQLSAALTPQDQIVVDGGGTVNQIAFQTLNLQLGQRLVISSGLCAMGSGLPESVGACFAADGRRTILLNGDGSLQLNIQELQTLVHHRLPVKIFVLCNEGYVSIRTTQNGFLNGHHVGSAAEGGMSLPDYRKVAAAYGVTTFRIENHRELHDGIARALAHPGPVLCELAVAADHGAQPCQGFDRRPDGTGVPRPLEDMAPFLPDDEFRRAMFVQPWGTTRG